MRLRFPHVAVGFAGLLILGVGWLSADEMLKQGGKAESTTPESAPLYERDILPLFKSKCTKCHNPKELKGELDLTTLSGLRKGSESGPVLKAGNVKESQLYKMLSLGLMPPKSVKDRPTKEQIETIRQWIAAGARTESVEAADAPAVTQHDIVPLVNLRCTVCHGLRRQEADLDLRTKVSMLKGGKSGPAIVLGKPEESLVLKRIHAQEMPPRKLLVDAGVRPITPPEINLLTQWIAAGAPEIEIKPDIARVDADPLVTDADRQFWSFQPPKRPAIPEVQHAGRVRNPIDAFILRKLEEKGLSLSSAAARITLVRRIAFDLTGLPPTPEDVQQFLTDKRPRAYERMVDRYLSSPRYGERWGRIWLDVAGYSDSEGKRSADAIRPHAWRYRDYVIRAFNADKPYDRFLLEQLAGDELADYENTPEITQELMDNLVATGFLRMAPDGTGSDIVNTVTERMEVISDQIHVFSSAILGLTIKCAQCHSHKYDPIPQRDYYRLVDVFKGAYDEHDWLKPTIVAGQSLSKASGRVLDYVTPAETEQWKQHNAPVQTQIDKLQAELRAQTQQLSKKHFDERIAKLPQELHDDLRKAFSTPAGKRNKIQKYLTDKFGKRLNITADALKKLDPQFKKLAAASDKKVKELQARLLPEPRIRALWDRGEPSPTYIYRRGEPTNPGRLVGPGVPSVLTDGTSTFEPEPPWPGAKKTGRRLALAKWLTAPKHPLTARVAVNRIWRHHFGVGIVKSQENFGKTGTPPTHPELLDWLAVEFIQRGWSIKEMHRLMLGSATYRQASAITPQHEQLDPANTLLSRMPLKRMDAEVVRDSIIDVAGRLDSTPFGPPDPVTVREDGLVTSIGTDRGWRRTIYVRQRRKEMLTILENFDLPQMNPNCIERPDSTVASQALHLMNNGLIRELSVEFAKRLQREAGSDPLEQIDRAYRLAMGRPPTAEETQLNRETLVQLTEFWEQQLAEKPDPDGPTADTRALTWLCHTLLNSAAFLYID